MNETQDQNDLDVTIKAMKELSDAQYHQTCVLEDQLAESRRIHAATMRNLNRLYQERSLRRAAETT